jgi:Leucine-rich repeat (LRR) protein
MISLREFDIKGNEINGTIPGLALSQLKDLTLLKLSASFTGTIPYYLAGLSSLTDLYLDGNQLTGPIPARLYSMTQLKILQLQSNNLTGTLSTAIGGMTNLIDFRVSRNRMTGAIPTQLSRLTNLRLAWLHVNDFVGSVPNGTCSIESLEFLQADCNPAGSAPNPCRCCTACCERSNIDLCKDDGQLA